MYREGNNLTVRRVYGSNFDEPLARQDGSGTVQWYGRDHLGSVRQVFDNSTGAAVSTVDFDASGVVLSGTRVDRYGFTGREWDDTLGLQYSRARMYNPATGRWLQEDPLGHGAGDANLYRYVGNDPKNWIDPSGLAEAGGPGTQELIDWGTSLYEQYQQANGGSQSQGPRDPEVMLLPMVPDKPRYLEFDENFEPILPTPRSMLLPYRPDENDIIPHVRHMTMAYDRHGNPIRHEPRRFDRDKFLNQWLEDRQAEANGQMILRDKDGNVRAIGHVAHAVWQPVDMDQAFAAFNALFNQMMNPGPSGPSNQAMADGPGGVMQYGGSGPAALQLDPYLDPDEEYDLSGYMSDPGKMYDDGINEIIGIYGHFINGAYQAVDSMFTLGGPPIPRFDKAFITGESQYIWDPSYAKRQAINGMINGISDDYNGYRDHDYSIAMSVWGAIMCNAPILSSVVSGLEASVGLSMHGQDLGRRLNPEERAERLGGFAVDAAGTFIAGGVLRGGGGKGTAVRGTNPSPTGPKFKSWNDFQAGTKGQFKSRAEAAKAWIAYKEANGITTGTVRSQAVKRQFLISMSRNPNTPSWMKPWLSRGQVPPGYQVDHINPLSIGGPDIPSNMRLQGIDLHKLHHFHYHPWRTP